MGSQHRVAQVTVWAEPSGSVSIEGVKWPPINPQRLLSAGLAGDAVSMRLPQIVALLVVESGAGVVTDVEVDELTMPSAAYAATDPDALSELRQIVHDAYWASCDGAVGVTVGNRRQKQALRVAHKELAYEVRLCCDPVNDESVTVSFTDAQIRLISDYAPDAVAGRDWPASKVAFASADDLDAFRSAIAGITDPDALAALLDGAGVTGRERSTALRVAKGLADRLGD